MVHFHNFKSLSLLAAFFCCLTFATAQKFEGTIKIETTATRPSSINTLFTMKKEMVMLDVESKRGAVKMIQNKDTNEKTTIREIDGDTIVITKKSNANRYKELNKKYENERARISNVTVKVTRETKKINGYKCYRVIASDNNYEGEAWMTKDLEVSPYDYFPSLKSNQRGLPRVGKALHNSMEGFVMEMTLKSLRDEKIEKVVVTVDKKKVDEAVFAVDLTKHEVYDEERVRELMKNAKGKPDQMRKARVILAQIRMQ